MFRLPLRTQELGAQSLISDGGYVSQVEVEQLIHKVDSMALGLLMFTKHVKKLKVYIVDEHGGVRMTTNAQVQWLPAIE